MFESGTVERVRRATLAMQRYSWEQGVVAQAFLESGDVETTVTLALEGAHRQIGDGRCAQIGEPCAVTAPCAIGEALICALEATGDQYFKRALDALLHWALQAAPRNAEGTVYHLDDKPQFWEDSFYMLPPFLARAGFFDEALKQLDGYWKALFRPEKSLLAHIWDDGGQKFIREAVWGVGNGWAAAGMARVIALLPAGYEAQRDRLTGRVKTLLDAALRFQRRDALFHDVLDDPDSFVEANAAQMFAYAIFRGVKEGYLDSAYLPAAQAIYRAATAKVDLYGIVRDVCGAPDFNAPGTAPEGQAFYLLMDAARRSGGFDR
jgi:rhamnogalacturonyl hydrolase YesR